jgi:hypothetical protein
VSLIPNVSNRVAGVEEKHENQGRTARIEEGRDRYSYMAGCLRRKKNCIVSVTNHRCPSPLPLQVYVVKDTWAEFSPRWHAGPTHPSNTAH